MSTTRNYRSSSNRSSRTSSYDTHRTTNYTEFNHDNLARKYSVKAEKIEKGKIKAHTRREKYKKGEARAQARINSGIDFLSATVLVASLALIFGFALNYLTLSSQIIGMKSNVSSLRTELSNAKSANDEAYSAVDSSMDIGYVYDTAVEQLGMVYPSDEQVITYSPVEEGYVRQYSEVEQK